MAKIVSKISDFFAFIFIGIIKIYQYTLSPIVGRQCRFTPSCSHYGIKAIQIHGPVKGLFLTIYRILRCNPWGGSGYDPVPDKKAKNNKREK